MVDRMNMAWKGTNFVFREIFKSSLVITYQIYIFFFN